VPSTLTVTNNLDSGAGSLRYEIAHAVKNDTIVFAPSLDGQTITLTSGELQIAQTSQIQGPSAGQLTISGGFTSRVFEVDGAGTTVSLSGLTIIDGDGVAGGTAQSNDGFGGAILNSGTLTVSGCTLSDNTADDGDGIYNNHGTLTVSTSTLSGNYSSGNYNYTALGGGICNAGTATVNGCTLSGNSGVDGGGICNFGTATVDGCTLSGNKSAGYGGGICNFGTLALSGCTLSSNIAANGGGIYNVRTLTVSGCTLSYNVAINSGGGIWNGGNGTLTVSNSVFTDNTPSDIFSLRRWINGGGNTFN